MPVQLSSAAAAMHGAIVPIGSTTFGGSTSDVEFTNIPQVYQDLFFVVYGRGTFGANEVLIQSYANNDFSSIYSTTRLDGDGSSATSSRTTGNSGFHFGYIPSANSTSGAFGSITGHILNYANSTTFKTSLTRYANDRNGAGNTGLYAGLYRSTAAITRLGIATYGVGNFVSGSTITLYGVRRAGQ
jgi:hypothetical protein